MVKAREFAWSSLKTVRAYAKRYGWGIRKAQQQASWRFDAANPDDIMRYFGSLKETREVFEITTAEQIHGGDELRLCAEFQQTGELVEVMVANGPEHCRENHALRQAAKTISNEGLHFDCPFAAMSLAITLCTHMYVFRSHQISHASRRCARIKWRWAKIWFEEHKWPAAERAHIFRKHQHEQT